MKNRTVRRGRKTKLPVWMPLVVVSGLGILFAFQVWLTSPPKPKRFVSVLSTVLPSPITAKFRNESLAGISSFATPAQITNTTENLFPVSDKFLSVEILCEGQVVGKGLICTNQNGEIRGGTVGHLFPEGRPEARYTYKIVSDRSSDTNQYGISRVEKVTVQTIKPGGSRLEVIKTEADLAVFYPGEAIPIKGFSPFKPGVKEGLETIALWVQPAKLISVHSKETFQSPAFMVNSQFCEVRIFAYPHHLGDSGEGFVNEKGDPFFLLGEGTITNTIPELSGLMARAIRFVGLDKY